MFDPVHLHTLDLERGFSRQPGKSQGQLHVTNLMPIPSAANQIMSVSDPWGNPNRVGSNHREALIRSNRHVAHKIIRELSL
jgi:hypothetical protein